MATAVKCPFCFWVLSEDDAKHSCQDCPAVLHAECWQENGGCTTFGCPSWATSQGVPSAAVAPVLPPPPPTAAAAPVPNAAPPLPGVATTIAQFCDQCGTAVVSQDRFCASCGNTL
jgi:hypothetical protein